jgi:hypothetical protein
MPSQPKITSTPIEVVNRLEELGMPDRDTLIAVAEAMVSARTECTDNDPPGAPGWSSWRMGTRRLREETLSKDGWERDDTDQIPSVVCRARNIRIAVSNTDDGTCDEGGRSPQNSSKKGAATDRAIQVNQGSFFDVLDASLTNVVAFPGNDDASTPTLITWYLCVYCNGEDIRAELSCPISVEAGFFSGFNERIFIVGHDGSDGMPVRRIIPNENDDSSNGEGLEIVVRRK